MFRTYMLKIFPTAIQKLSILWKKVNARQLTIIKIFFLATLLVLVGFAVDFLSFSYGMTRQHNPYQGRIFPEEDLLHTNGFTKDSDGVLISQVENASLVIKNDSRFINNLELELGRNPNHNVKIEYFDQKKDGPVVLKANAQSDLEKNKLSFLHLAIFHIDSNPSEIKIIAEKAGSEISQVIIDNSYHFNPHRFLFFSIVGTLLIFFILFRRKIGSRPEYAFLAIAIAVGSIISFSEPRTLFVSWDERVHYGNVEKLVPLSREKLNNFSTISHKIPYSPSIKEQSIIENYLDGRPKTQIPHQDRPAPSATYWYNNLCYLPSSLVLVLGKTLHLPYHLVIVLGRWINIIIYSLIVFFAIRKLKSGKMLLSIIALLPTSIFIASNYNYDSWTLGFTMLSLSYLFSTVQRPGEKITRHEMTVILGAMIIGLGPKAIYFPLFFLIFILRPAQFDSPKQYRKFLIATILSMLFVIGTFLLPFLLSGHGGDDNRGGKGVDSAKQLAFILSEPLTYAKILSNFMQDYFSLENTREFTTLWASLGNILGYPILIIMLILVSLTDKNICNKPLNSLKIKLLVILICLVTVSLIATALYLSFTPAYNKMINGVQPRYLLPLLFPLLFVIGDYRLKNPFDKNIYHAIIFIILSVILLSGSWNLITKIHY